MINDKFTKEEKELESIRKDMEDLEWYIEEFSTFLPLAVCALNPLGIIVNVNRAFEKLTGLKASVIIRERIENIFSEKDLVKKLLDDLRKDENNKKGALKRELTLIAVDGNKIISNVFAAARNDSKGDFIGYFIAIVDITELKHLQLNLEKKVAERTKELQEKLEDLEKFAKITIDRELKMVELKNKIKEIEK